MPARWSSDSPTPSEESNPWLSRKIALGAWDSTITTALKKERKESKAHALAVEAYNSGGYDAGQLPAPAWATIRLALKAVSDEVQHLLRLRLAPEDWALQPVPALAAALARRSPEAWARAVREWEERCAEWLDAAEGDDGADADADDGAVPLDPSLHDPETARRKFRSRSVLKSERGVVDTAAARERASERQLQLEAAGLAAEVAAAKASAARQARADGDGDAALEVAVPDDDDDDEAVGDDEEEYGWDRDASYAGRFVRAGQVALVLASFRGAPPEAYVALGEAIAAAAPTLERAMQLPALPRSLVAPLGSCGRLSLLSLSAPPPSHLRRLGALLALLPSLTSLCLADVDIKDTDAAAAVARALPRAAALHTLVLPRLRSSADGDADGADGAAPPSEAIAGAVGAILTGALRPPPTGSLRSLVLAGTNLGEGGGVLLASALLGGSGDFEIEIDVDAPPPPPPPAAPALAALDVRGCGLGGAGMRGIAELLRHSTTLRVLALSGSRVRALQPPVGSDRRRRLHAALWSRRRGEAAPRCPPRRRGGEDARSRRRSRSAAADARVVTDAARRPAGLLGCGGDARFDPAARGGGGGRRGAGASRALRCRRLRLHADLPPEIHVDDADAIQRIVGEACSALSRAAARSCRRGTPTTTSPSSRRTRSRSLPRSGRKYSRGCAAPSRRCSGGGSRCVGRVGTRIRRASACGVWRRW